VAADCQQIGQPRRYEPFDLELTFASVNEQLGASLLRLSPAARRIDRADQIVIALSDTVALRDTLRHGPATLTLQGDGQGEADLTLMLLGRCAHSTGALAAEGTLTLFDYGWRDGARVKGEMDFDLIDRRSGEIAGEGFVGAFDFTSQTGTPHTAFAPKDY